jgi:hypothetical protein
MGKRVYPKGRIAYGSGDLIQVTNVKYSHTNNVKQVHTIVEKGSGITTGVEETTVSFDSVVSAAGAERNYFALVKSGVITDLRLKVPFETINVEGAFKSRDFELPLDDSIKLSLQFIGHTV